MSPVAVPQVPGPKTKSRTGRPPTRALRYTLPERGGAYFLMYCFTGCLRAVFSELM
jgi:hypothetical protein